MVTKGVFVIFENPARFSSPRANGNSFDNSVRIPGGEDYEGVDNLVRAIPNARSGFRLIFSPTP